MPIAPWTRPLTIGHRLAASLITGFAVAATTHLATLLVFFAANGSAAANLAPISAYFLPASLVLFVLASLAASLGSNRFWFTALGVGLVVAALAAALGTAYAIVAGGKVWSPAAVDFVVASLGGNNLVFVVSAAIAAVTVGRRLWAFATRSSGSARPIALVRQPSSRLQDGELSHLERTTVDRSLADEQWDAYVEALEAGGFEVMEVPAADELPDSVFVEDVLVVFGGTAVVTSPGAESRRPETDAAAGVAKKLGLIVRTVDLPGTLDGGDVLTVGSTVYVGRSARTNAEGVRQLREIVSPLGFSVVAVPVTKSLHLKSVVTALPDGTVIGFSKLVDSPQLFDRYLAVPEASGAAVVVLGPGSVLMAASAPESAALIESLGYRVVTVDVSEFEKLEGCVTCLSVRIR